MIDVFAVSQGDGLVRGHSLLLLLYFLRLDFLESKDYGGKLEDYRNAATIISNYSFSTHII
jgi:hypothetical protein